MSDNRLDQERTSSSRGRSGGELVVDLVIVVGAALYVWTARNYPSAGRQIPTVVGVIVLVVGLVQLVGWFTPGLWQLTHGVKPGSDKPAGGQTASRHTVSGAVAADAAAVDDRSTEVTDVAGVSPPGTAVYDADGAQERRQNRDTMIVVMWAAGFLAAILVLGYRYAVPVFFLAYFGRRRQWRLAVVSAVAMWALTQFVFISLLGIHLPTSQFFVF